MLSPATFLGLRARPALRLLPCGAPAPEPIVFDVAPDPDPEYVRVTCRTAAGRVLYRASMWRPMWEAEREYRLVEAETFEQRRRAALTLV